MSFVRTRMVFAEGWQERFAGWGLRRFEDFFDHDEGLLINRNTKRNVVEMRLGGGENPEIFYRKLFFSPHWKDVWFTLRNFGAICSQAACEWKNAHALLDLGVETYRPVCYGEETMFGIERRSFFVTARLAGPCLTDWLRENRPDSKSQNLTMMILELGRLFRRVHDAGIRLPDLYVWHVFLTGRQPWSPESFALIDLHRMMVRRKDPAQRASDLGAFLYSMAEPFFDERLRKLLVDSYLENGLDGNRERFCAAVDRRRRTLERRRQIPEYARTDESTKADAITPSCGG